MLSDIGGPVPGPLSPQLCSPMLCFTAGTHRDPGGRRLTVSKSQLSLPVIEYFQSFQVGCKHLKNIIWNQIPQSLSGVHQSFIDAYDFCWGLWFLRQLRDCCLGLAAALWMGESSAVLQPLPSPSGLPTPSPRLAARQDWALLTAQEPNVSWGTGKRIFSLLVSGFLQVVSGYSSHQAVWEASLRCSVHPERSTASSLGNPNQIPHLKPYQRDKKIHSAYITFCSSGSSLWSDGWRAFFKGIR